MARWLVTVNRAAGRKETRVDDVRDALKSADIDAEIEVPATAEEATSTIRTAALAGHTHFAVAGGDGTTNLAVNALMPLDLDVPPVLGVLPSGTGCDLLRTFGLPQDLGRAAAHLASDDTYAIDIGVLQGQWGIRYFANVAQVGVGAAAAETAPKLSRGLGPVRYPLAFGVRLPRFPYAEVTVTTERRTYESEAIAVVLANAQFFAGGWNVAPKATLVDGVLDMQIINARKVKAPALVPKIIRGTHLKDPAVRRFKAAEFKIETSPKWPLEADGDFVGNTTVTGHVVPAAIHLKI